MNKETTTATRPAPEYPTPADALRALQGPDALAVLDRAARWAIRYKETAPHGEDGRGEITAETADRLRTQELDDLRQETARRFLDALADGKTTAKDGEPLTGSRMLRRAALAAVQKVIRDYYKRPTAARIVETPAPERTAVDRDTIRAAVAAMPDAYRGDALDVAALIAAGESAASAADLLGINPRRARRIAAALRETPAALDAADRETARRNASRREAAGLAAYEESTRRAYHADEARRAYMAELANRRPVYFTPEEAAEIAAAREAATK